MRFWIILNTSCFIVSTVTGCVSISCFSSSVSIPVDIASSALGWKTSVTTVGNKKYKIITKKKKRSMIK